MTDPYPKLQLTPFFALRDIEDEPSRSLFYDAFLRLRPEERDLLIARESADVIQRFSENMGIPVAAKVFSFCARQILCDLSTSEELAPWLSEQTGLPIDKAGLAIQRLVTELKTIRVSLKNDVRESSPPVIPGQQVNPNNIIDLRQQNK